MIKKIIATGISGLVGSRIVELLPNYEFINFSLDKGIDITNFSLLEKNIVQHQDSNIIIHLAAFTNVSQAFVQNEYKNGSCYLVNVVGSKNIAQLCKKYNKYLITISTDFVFDGKNPPKSGYTENYQPNPLEWYGKTKLMAEQIVLKTNPRNLILRIAFPYKAKEANSNIEAIVKLDFIRIIKKRLINENKVNLFSDQIITPTFIDDISVVLDKCIQKKPSGVYHCVGSSSHSPYQIGLKVAAAYNLDKNKLIPTSLAKYQKNNPFDRPRQMSLLISNKKLQQDFGIKMKTLDEGLEEIKRQLI